MFSSVVNATVVKEPYKAVVLSQTVVSKESGRYCAWPSIAKLPGGRLVVVYSGDRDWHVCPWGKIRMVFSDDNGARWSSPQTIVDTPLDDRDAGILVTQKGTILVSWITSVEFANTNSPFYDTRYSRYAEHTKGLDAATRAQWKGAWVCRSENNGKTWSEPIKIPGVTPHGPIQLKDGRILMVSSGGVAASLDDGLSWRKIAGFGKEEFGRLSEVNAIERDDGKIVVLSRADKLRQFGSCDGGQTWSLPVETGISGYPPQMIKLKNGWLVAVYGRRKSLPNGQFACISKDGGKTWNVENEITLSVADKHRGTEDELGYPPNWDLGYPCSVLLDDGTIWTVYYQTDKKGEWPSIMGTHWKLDIKDAGNTDVVIETFGGADPEDAGFVMDGKGTFSIGCGNDGEDYWFARSTKSAYYLYSAKASDFQDPRGWTATYRTKIIPQNTAHFTDNFFAARNGSHRFDLSIFGGAGSNVAGVYVLLKKAGYTRIDSCAIDVTEYHTYQVVYNPDTKMASYYVDGTLLATYPETMNYTTKLTELRWGDQYSKVTDPYENRYSLVRLETGYHIVPEFDRY